MSNQSTSQETHLKVNNLMRSKGFVWSLHPGTKEKPNLAEGVWRKEKLHFTQEQAVYIYENLYRKWWQR